MDTNRELEKIILINGASSSGKSTLARQLQQTLPIPFWHFSFDHLRDSNALPMTRIRSGEIDWSAMRPAVFDGSVESAKEAIDVLERLERTIK